MSYCLNSQCQKPLNPDGTKFCLSCGLRILLGDRYLPLQPLGQGGFGKTFLAVDEHKPSRPHGAIKQFFPQGRGTENAQKAAELFRHEAEHLDALGKHPQIAELWAYFEQDSHQYLVQEYIEGENLERVLAKEGAFTESQILQFLNDLLPVLQFVHDHLVIHRDIKPSNIIRRNPDRQLVLVDFGAAKLTIGIALEMTGTVIGSAGYTAPEQLLGKAMFASDLYSLGVTCIHLLTQVHPVDLFDPYPNAWVWRNYLKHPISPHVAEILDKLLQQPINQRYQSAEEVLKDLHSETVETALTAVPIQPSPSLPGNQTWKYIGTIFGHSTPVLAVAIAADGQTLASSSQNGTIKVWNLGAQIEALAKLKASCTFSEGGGCVQAIAIHPDSKILASGHQDGSIKYWQMETGELINRFAGHSSAIQSIVISADGQILVSAGDNKNIKLWRFETQELLRTFSGASRLYTIALSPDRKILAGGYQDGTIQLWNLRTGKLILTLQGRSGAIYTVAFSPDGQILAAGGQGRTIQIWNLETGEEMGKLTGNLYAVRSLRFSPDGQTLASGGEDSTIKFWHWRTGEAIASFPHHLQLVSAVAFSPDGQMLASASHDKSIKLWRLSQS